MSFAIQLSTVPFIQYVLCPLKSGCTQINFQRIKLRLLNEFYLVYLLSCYTHISIDYYERETAVPPTDASSSEIIGSPSIQSSEMQIHSNDFRTTETRVMRQVFTHCKTSMCNI